MKTKSPLDKKDMLLLYLLDINGRMSHSKLARKAGISKQLVKYRIGRLEKNGLIRGYFAMIDSSKLGYTTFRLYIKFRNVTPDRKKEIIDYLKKQKPIWAVIVLSGKWDIAAGIAVKDIYGYYDVWEDILRLFLDNIADYKVSVYSPICHYSKSYLIGKEDDLKPRIMGGNMKVAFDDIDIRILSVLSKDARMPLVKICTRIKQSAQSVSRRIKQLEKKNIILGYRAMIDVEKLGYEFYKAEIRLSSYDKIKKIEYFCQRHPNIYQIDNTIGGETLEIEFHVKSLKQMLLIIEEIELYFGKMIDWFDYIRVISEEKTTYMPDT